MCKTINDQFACDSHVLSRRDFARLALRAALAPMALSVGAAALQGCGKSDQGSNQATDQSKADTAKKTLRIGYLPITDATPLLIGYAKGFFQEEGIQVEKPSLVRSWAQLAESFLAGSYNLVHLLMPIPIFMRFGQHHPVKVVAWNHINGSALTVAAAGNVAGLESLGGKQIAVPHWYSIHNVILQGVLRQRGLEAVIQDRKAPLKANQTNLFVMAPPDMPTAMANGAIDGYIVAEPFNAVGETLAGGKIARFTGDLFKNHPCCVATMHEADIDGDPAWAQGVLNGLVKAQRWVTQNRQEAAALMSKEGGGYLPQQQKVIERAMNYYDVPFYGPQGTGAIQHPDWECKRIGFNPYPYESATREIVNLLKNTKLDGVSGFLGTLEPELVVKDLFNYDLVKNAIAKTGGMTGFDGVTGTDAFTRNEVIQF